MAAHLRPLAAFLQANPARTLLGLTACLLLLSLAIRSAKLDGRLASWIQHDPKVADQLEHAHASLPEGTGSTSQLLLQVARKPAEDMLSSEALLVHLDALLVAAHVTVDLFDVSWTLKDLCFTPTLPDYDGLHVSLALDNMMPCAIKTPLDCFWEGAKLHGPEQPVSMGALGPKLKWTNLNPYPLVEALKQDHPHASFPYDSLLAWMRRVGISSGYQLKPCLDPSDPNCPDTAPNKNSGLMPDIGASLTGGCRGIASLQMHWREEEIVAGLQRNRSTGNIVNAQALQSTIELMGEQDMYDYWRKTSKVQDINNWSAEKARLVIESWQRRLKEELTLFARTSPSSKHFKIHTITSRTTTEPMDAYSLLDLTNLEYCFILMTIFTIITYPSFKLSSSTSSNLLKNTLLPLVTSSAVGLTLVASLGIAAFVDLPFNMATLQILPPLALLYGFGQNLMVAGVFSRQLCGSSPKQSAEVSITECLHELLPMIITESLTHMTTLLVAAIIPIAATRAFALQAIIYVTLTSLSAMFLIPSIIITFNSCRPQSDSEPNESSLQEKPTKSFRPRAGSPFKFSTSRAELRLGAKDKISESSTSIEDQILERIQHDLKHIRADSCQPTNIDFSAQLDSGVLRTSFKLTTSHQTTNFDETSSSATSLNSLPQPTTPTNKSALPDLIASIAPTVIESNESSKPIKVDKADLVVDKKEVPETRSTIIQQIIVSLSTNRLTQIVVGIFKLGTLVAMLTQINNIRYGLSLTDIVARGTMEHESLYLQERHFPIYNIFAITKGNFDYPSNQKLLLEYYKALERADAVVQLDVNDKPKFWLINFRDWLLELQSSFDNERNKSTISVDGWTDEASDLAKLAYKLLAQTGKHDNPIDKNLVETNRLVDSKGVINQKAFYYYLAAWVVNDPFTYATSEANFKPEPKIWNYNPDDLRVEKARPISYAQIPLLIKLPADQDNLKRISELRRISQAFEEFNLPNLLNGVPFIYWEQFANLDLVMIVAAISSVVIVFIVIGFLMSDVNLAILIASPMAVTLLELYCLLGVTLVQFNNILAVLLLANTGYASTHAVHYIVVSISKLNEFLFQHLY